MKRGGERSGAADKVSRCVGRRRPGPGAPAAVTEEEHCTVERRADLSYAEFVQRYLRPPVGPHLPETCP